MHQQVCIWSRRCYCNKFTSFCMLHVYMYITWLMTHVHPPFSKVCIWAWNYIENGTYASDCSGNRKRSIRKKDGKLVLREGEVYYEKKSTKRRKTEKNYKIHLCNKLPKIRTLSCIRITLYLLKRDKVKPHLYLHLPLRRKLTTVPRCDW